MRTDLGSYQHDSRVCISLERRSIAFGWHDLPVRMGMGWKYEPRVNVEDATYVSQYDPSADPPAAYLEVPLQKGVTSSSMRSTMASHAKRPISQGVECASRRGRGSPWTAATHSVEAFS